MSNIWETTVTVWVNALDEGQYGPTLRCAWNERKKNEATGEWENGEKVRIDVAGAPELLRQFAEVKRVTIKGRITKVRPFEKRDGGLDASVRIWATDITAFESNAEKSAEDVLSSMGATEIDPDDARKYGTSYAPF